MYVDKIMTTEVISITQDSRINEMLELMQKYKLQHLPVVNKAAEIIGLVAHQDIQKAAPSAITTLSVGESNYLLAKILAKQIMQSKVLSCKPTTLIEHAGQIMREHGVSSLPVVENAKLVGIVTLEDILDFFLDLTGCSQSDATRIAVRLSDEKGSLSHLINIINDLGGYIATVVSPTELDQEGKRICIVRYYADNPHLLDKQLVEAGIEIISENFLAEPDTGNVSIPLNPDNHINPTVAQQIGLFISQNDQLAKAMNMQLQSVSSGACQLSMKVTPQLLNGAGILHGGAAFALADVAVAIASNSHNQVSLSLDSNIKYLATSKPGDYLIATAKEISLGRTIANYQVEIKRQSDDVLTALFTGSVFRKQHKLIEV